MDKSDRAKEKLRELKNRWGATWAEMGFVLGMGYRWTSLSSYASQGGKARPIPEWLANRILAFDLATKPDLGREMPQGARAVILSNGDVRIMDIPNLRFCLYCGSPFIPSHHQQLYCDGYRGECGLGMRRKRYAKSKSG